MKKNWRFLSRQIYLCKTSMLSHLNVSRGTIKNAEWWSWMAAIRSMWSTMGRKPLTDTNQSQPGADPDRVTPFSWRHSRNSNCVRAPTGRAHKSSLTAF